MFFRKKRNKDNERDLNGQCESPSCPSPTTIYLKTELVELNGKFLCQFCYTRKLSEKTVTTTFEEPKTKKVAQIETNRISTTGPTWSLNTVSGGNLSRIGPSSDNEKYIEEKNIWKDILQALGYDVEYSSIKDINKLSKNPKVRFLDTEGGKLILSFSTKKEIDLKTNELALQKEIFSIEVPELSYYDLKNIHDRYKEWITQNHILNEAENIEDFLLLITKLPTGQFFSLEEIPDSDIHFENNELLYELGKYFYFLNLLGCLNLTQISVIKSGLNYLFINSSSDYGEKAFPDVKAALQQIYVTLPFIVDEENSVSFFEGASEQKSAFEKLFSTSSESRDKIFDFFDKHQIKLDKSNSLISLDSFM